MLGCIIMCSYLSNPLLVSSASMSCYSCPIQFVHSTAVVTVVMVELLSDTSVNVSWGSVSVPGIVSYTVYYRPTDTVGSQSERSVTVPSSESSVVIEDLVTNVEYQFQATATAELGGVVYPGERSPPTTLLLVTLITTPPNSTPAIDTTATINTSITAISGESYTLVG